MNMLPVRWERTHAFTQAAIHNRHHIHQRDSDNPQRSDRADGMRFTLGGFQQDPDDGEANHGAAGVTHKNFIAAAEGAKIEKNIG